MVPDKERKGIGAGIAGHGEPEHFTRLIRFQSL